jgi:outer membrane protein assembly factor BamB
MFDDVVGRRCLLGLLCGGLGVSSPRLNSADQPQWGQQFTRNMVSEERGLPDALDPKSGLNLKWMARLGTETHATPVVARGKVLIGTNNGAPRDERHKGDRGVLMCFNERDGRFHWQLVVPKLTTSIFWDWPNAGICSPATVEGDRVYLVSNRGEVMCLDLHGQSNGNDGPYREEASHCVPPGADPIPVKATDADIVWLLDMVKDLGVRQHDSAHCSILLHGQYLYVATSNGVDDSHRRIDAPDAPSLIVVDKDTGRLVAQDGERIGPRIFHSTWSSPALGEVNGRSLVLFAGGDGVIYAFEPVNTASPPCQVAKLTKVAWFDCDPDAPKEDVHRYNSNRRESPSNVKSMPVFHNGRVYVTVGGDLWWGKNEAWLKCIDVAKTGDLTPSGGLWSYALQRHCMSTPSVQSGLAFVADCGRRVHCVDTRTGQACWTHETRGDIWASTLAADGKVYVGTRRGDFWIFAASHEKRILGTIEFGSPISATPVAANGVLYVTTMTHLYAFQTGARTQL